jgi:hypothetical protein
MALTTLPCATVLACDTMLEKVNVNELHNSGSCMYTAYVQFSDFL